MSFDYGTEEKIGSSADIKKWPVEGDMTALVDADAVAYIVGYTSDLQQYLKMKRDKDWKDSDIFRSKKEHASFMLNKWINNAKCDSAILFMTDGKSNFRLEIAKSKVYKGERIDEKPPFFYEIREWLLEFHEARLSINCEADDEISIEAWRRHVKFGEDMWTASHKAFSDCVVISNDKDLGIIPGWRCHPVIGELEWVEPLGRLDPKWKEKEVNDYEYWPLFKGKPVDLIACNVPMIYAGRIEIKIKGELKSPKNKWELDYVWNKEAQQQDIYGRGVKKGIGKFKRVCVGKKKSEYIDKLKGVGLKFFYSQLIVGDTADNYDGIPGKGDTFAYKLLDDATNEQELFTRVLQAYVNYCGTEEAAEELMLEQGRLAHMQTVSGELWNLPRQNRQTFPK